MLTLKELKMAKVTNNKEDSVFGGGAGVISINLRGKPSRSATKKSAETQGSRAALEPRNETSQQTKAGGTHSTSSAKTS